MKPINQKYRYNIINNENTNNIRYKYITYTVSEKTKDISQNMSDWKSKNVN